MQGNVKRPRIRQRGGQRACAGDEAQGVKAGLHVLPKLQVAVVEDVAAPVQVAKALRREHHGHVIAGVEQRQRPQEEVRLWDVVRVKEAEQLITRDRVILRQGKTAVISA